MFSGLKPAWSSPNLYSTTSLSLFQNCCDYVEEFLAVKFIKVQVQVQVQVVWQNTDNKLVHSIWYHLAEIFNFKILINKLKSLINSSRNVICVPKLLFLNDTLGEWESATVIFLLGSCLICSSSLTRSYRVFPQLLVSLTPISSSNNCFKPSSLACSNFTHIDDNTFAWGTPIINAVQNNYIWTSWHNTIYFFAHKFLSCCLLVPFHFRKVKSKGVGRQETRWKS